MRRLTPLVMGLLGAFAARSASARETRCEHLAVDTDRTLRSRWPELPLRIQEEFDGRDDVDRCARVHLVATDGSILVEVVLRDGRSASRVVSKREDVVPTLDALLLVPRRGTAPEASPEGGALPQTSPIEASASSGPVETTPAPVADAPSASATKISSVTNVLSSSPAITPERDVRRAPPNDRNGREDHLRIELSVLGGARIGDGQRSGGGGILSFLDMDGWLVGFEGRADRYETLAGVLSGPALELAALGGRRFRAGALALDLTAGFAGAVQGTVTHETPTSSESSSSVAPRFLVGTRLNFGARSTLRGFVGIDGEVGPPRASSDVDFPEAPRLPRWTVGIALGATVGTL